MSQWETESINRAMQAMSSWSTPNGAIISDQPSQEAIDYLNNIASNHIFDYLARQEVLTKANLYKIYYDPRNVDLLKLSHLIEDWEILLSIAQTRYDIDWDSSNYDPIALEQEMEDYEDRARDESKDLWNYYNDTRL